MLFKTLSREVVRVSLPRQPVTKFNASVR